jgi:hypothetical protein
MRQVATLIVTSAILSGCVMGRIGSNSPPRVTLPAIPGWYNGTRLYYITTEITDPAMARNAGVTYAPRMTDAVPEYPKPPELRTVLERVYKFPDGEQDAVFASAPTPPGPESSDTAYSPLWIVYLVRWLDGARPHSLTREQAILDAADNNEVSVERTRIVVNCPIVWTDTGGGLPHSVLNR